jgi:hypothetical protein
MSVISELTSDQLKAKKASMEAMLVERQKASKHTKFNAMQFPPPGNTFVALKNDVDAEIKKRGLWI